jgi:hypothetical protein
MAAEEALQRFFQDPVNIHDEPIDLTRFLDSDGTKCNLCFGDASNNFNTDPIKRHRDEDFGLHLKVILWRFRGNEALLRQELGIPVGPVPDAFYVHCHTCYKCYKNLEEFNSIYGRDKRDVHLQLQDIAINAKDPAWRNPRGLGPYLG